MALAPPLYYNDLAAFRSAGLFPFGGTQFDQLAWAIANAVGSWGPTVQFQGVVVGTAGAGAINVPTTKVTLTPNPGLVIGGLASAGMVGPLSTALGTVVGMAIPTTITAFGNYAGGVVGVGIGADVSKAILADEALLFTLLLANMAGGPAAVMMARGLSRGIASLLLTAVGVGSVVGSPSIAPASGSSTSVMV